MVRATFVMEQHIGHRAYYENLRRFVDQSPRLAARWIEVTYNRPGSAWQRLPLLPDHVRGTLVGRSQVRDGLRRQPADVTLFNTQVPAALGGRLVKQRPYVLCTDITPRQYDQMAAHYNHRPDRDGLLSRYKHRANVQLLRGAARLLPWSSWTAASLVADYGVVPERIEVVAPGVDTAVWQPRALEETERPLRILFVGGDLYRKGGEMLLEAFHTLPAGQAELELVTRTALTPPPGVTLHHDMQPNSAALIALYQSCDLFVLPTHAEAFGIAAVEATAVGLPVIATRVGGLTDVVADGETGFLIAPGDTAALSQRLRLLLEDEALRRRMSRAARARAVSCFDARRNAQRVVDILLETAVERTQQETKR